MSLSVALVAASSPAASPAAAQGAPSPVVRYPFEGAGEVPPEGPEVPPEPRPKGIGILASGVVLLVAGIPLVTRGSTPSFRYTFDCWDQACFDAEERRARIFLGVGIAAMVLGAGLTIAGSVFLYRHRRWSTLKARLSASPGGVALRF